MSEQIKNPVITPYCLHCKQPIECIDVIRHMSFNLGMIVKILWFSDYKDDLEELKLAEWYLNDLISEIVRKNTLTTVSSNFPSEPVAPIYNNGHSLPLNRMEKMQGFASASSVKHER